MWPYPRVFQTEYRTLMIVRQNSGVLILLEIENRGYWVTHPVLQFPSEISFIDFADFGPFYVISVTQPDDTIVTYIRDLRYPEPSLYGGYTNFTPTFGAICHFNGQFIGGNTPWQGIGENGIAWSAIGNFEFNPEVDLTSGFRQLFFPTGGAREGKILRVAKLGNRVIVYADNGKLALSPNTVGNTFVYGEDALAGLGIRNPNHLAGDDTIHGFIDLNNEFHTITSNLKIEKLGYKEFLSTLDLLRTIVSFLPRDNKFYISDGIRSFVISNFGMHEISQCVSGIMYGFDGNILATFLDNLDDEARGTTEQLDYGSRGIKSVESIVGGLSHNEDSELWFSVNYRMAKNHPFSRYIDVTGGPTAESAIHVAALDFQLRFRISDYRDVEIDYLMANVKFSDQRFKRGTVPAQIEVRPERENVE